MRRLVRTVLLVVDWMPRVALLRLSTPSLKNSLAPTAMELRRSRRQLKV